MAGKTEWFNALAFYLWSPEGPAFGPDKAALPLWSSMKRHSASLGELRAEAFRAWEHRTDTLKKVPLQSLQCTGVVQIVGWKTLHLCSRTVFCTDFLLQVTGNQHLRGLVWVWWVLATSQGRAAVCATYELLACQLLERPELQLWAVLRVHPGRTVHGFLLLCPTLNPQELIWPGGSYICL